FHHPPYLSGDDHEPSTNMRWPFQQWGATAVFTGHSHTYERIVLNNFPYFVDGLGGESISGFGAPISGSQLRYNGNYGAMLVETSDTSVNFKFSTRNGTTVDNYTIGVPAPRTELIPEGDTWKYLDNGTNQGTAWRGT